MAIDVICHSSLFCLYVVIRQDSKMDPQKWEKLQNKFKKLKNIFSTKTEKQCI